MFCLDQPMEGGVVSISYTHCMDKWCHDYQGEMKERGGGREREGEEGRERRRGEEEGRRGREEGG